VRISLFHNTYRTRGGEDTVVDLQAQALAAHGHQVSRREVHNRDLKGLGAVRAAWNADWSLQAYEETVKELLRTRAEVGHIHNWFPLLSPSVYSAHQDLGIPVVQTLHNYRLGCAKGTYLREGQACFSCRDGDRHAAIRNRCYRDSRLQTAVWMRAVRSARSPESIAAVDAFVAPSEVVRREHLLLGLPAGRVHVIPHACADPFPAGAPPAPGEGAVFVGRLSPEKGVDVLLEAWKGLDLRLDVIGAGPQEVQASSSVRPRGALSPQDVQAAILAAGVLVLPHRWEEPFGMVVIEAFACGRPVIASNLGGPSELIQDGVDGVLVPPGDAGALRVAVRELLQDPERLRAMGAAARARYEREFRPQVQVRRLVRLYRQLRRLPAAQAS
jgi:glycosyltransferase involved in cell wall biosynthesis